jgi:hypothetical protein
VEVIIENRAAELGGDTDGRKLVLLLGVAMAVVACGLAVSWSRPRR